MIKAIVLTGLLVLSTSLSGQRIKTELLCEWRDNQAIPRGRGQSLSLGLPLAKGISLLTFADSTAAAATFRRLRIDPAVRNVQYNYYVRPRQVPNDPFYPQQENLIRAGFEAAWNVTTGGASPTGAPLVTAVLDGGFDTNHEDLRGSLWFNSGETAADNVDNDANGFVDDLHGWNFVTGSGNYRTDTHGTQVAGIIGAQGDNGIGIAGTNWDSQLMLFGISTVADIVAAYDYIIEQKTLHLRTAGQKGANVVVTNASFGIEGATCADFPVWGSMYDKLGSVGILTAASVANVAKDVDLAGDMPTDCPSLFLLGVTNLGSDDRLFPSAAYGRENVDIGAPGEGSISVRPGNRYGNFGSTSAAAAYVTGAISLLYATPCISFQQLVVGDPPAAALVVRDALLESVDRNTSLEFRSSSGGNLNVAKAQRQLLRRCEEANSAQLIVKSIYPNPVRDRVTVTVSSFLSDKTEVVLFNSLGQEMKPSNFRYNGVLPSSITVELAGFPGGGYVLRITDGGRVATATLLLD